VVATIVFLPLMQTGITFRQSRSRGVSELLEIR
jgi:hypothetical protein